MKRTAYQRQAALLIEVRETIELHANVRSLEEFAALLSAEQAYDRVSKRLYEYANPNSPLRRT